MANSVLCAKSGQRVNGKCANIKRMTLALKRDFICERCVEAMKAIVELA